MRGNRVRQATNAVAMWYTVGVCKDRTLSNWPNVLSHMEVQLRLIYMSLMCPHDVVNTAESSSSPAQTKIPGAQNTRDGKNRNPLFVLHPSNKIGTKEASGQLQNSIMWKTFSVYILRALQAQICERVHMSAKKNIFFLLIRPTGNNLGWHEPFHRWAHFNKSAAAPLTALPELPRAANRETNRKRYLLYHCVFQG